MFKKKQASIQTTSNAGYRDHTDPLFAQHKIENRASCWVRSLNGVT
jgi:hypothetical protein